MGNSHSHRKNRQHYHHQPQQQQHQQVEGSSSSLPLPTNPNYLYPPPPFIPQHNSQSQSSSMALTLPYSHVDSCLRALAGQAQGFGRSSIGGLHGPLFHVTTLAGQSLITPLFYGSISFFLLLFSC